MFPEIGILTVEPLPVATQIVEGDVEVGVGVGEGVAVELYVEDDVGLGVGAIIMYSGA